MPPERCPAGSSTGQRLRVCEAPGMLCPFLGLLQPSHGARFSAGPSTMDGQAQGKCRICKTRWRHSECIVRYSRFDSSVTETSFQRFRSPAEEHAQKGEHEPTPLINFDSSHAHYTGMRSHDYDRHIREDERVRVRKMRQRRHGR